MRSVSPETSVFAAAGVRVISFLLVIAATSLPAVAHAGVGVWTSGGPYAAWPNTLAIDPSNTSTLYAGTYNGVFKSTDAGGTWTAGNTGLQALYVSTLAINPVTSSTLYAATYNGVFRSTDSAKTWSVANTGLTTLGIYALAIDPATPSTLYVGTSGGGVFKSTDSGGTWLAVNTGLANLFVYAFAINPTTPSTLYAGTSTGVFKSTDSGGTWAAANTGLSGAHVYALAINPTTPSTLYAGTSSGGVFKSTDSGGTWVSAGTGLSGYVKALALNPTTPSTLYAGTDGQGVFESTDSGGTWTAVNVPGYVHALAIDPLTPATLYAGNNGYVLKSIDSGGTWRTINTGLTDLPIFALAIDPMAPSTLYAGNHGDVFKSTNAGRTWAWLNISFLDLDVHALAIDPTTPSTLYAGTFNGGVFKSTNSGGNWAGTSFICPQVRAIAINPTTPSTLYQGTGCGVYKSTDSESTWASSNTGLTTHDVRAFAIDPKIPSTLYAGTYGGGVFKSSDSGGTWAAASTGLTDLNVYALAIDLTTPSMLYAGTTGGVFKSTDSGGTWATTSAGLTSLDVRALAINPATPSTLYAGTFGSGVFKSTDAGGTWAAANAGLPWESSNVPQVSAFAIDPSGGTTVYVAFDGGSIWELSNSNPVSVPIVLSSAGLSGSFFTSELVLTNPGPSDVSVNYTYASAFGGASGTASETLAAGTQKIAPDAIGYLRGLEIPVGESGNRGGTLLIDFSGAGAATVRTTTAVSAGRAGLAYTGLPWLELLSAPVYLAGLRQNTFDRSNVAVVNAGGASDGPITLRLTVISGDPANPQAQAIPDITLSPGGFSQVSGVLASNGLSLTNGYVRVERISGSSPFYAYGVINDLANSDGSFVEPVPVSQTSVIPRLTLPVLVETGAFTSELVVTNFSSSSRTLHCLYVASALTGGQVSFDISLLHNEQQILPSVVQLLRDRGVIHDPTGPTFVGALFVTDATSDLRGVSVAARTSTPGDEGRYGLFYSAVPAGSEPTTTAWLYGLQQNAENRTNLALVNVGSADGSTDTFRIDLFDGAKGQKAGTTIVTVPAKGFVQVNAILSQFAPSVSSGYALVTRTSGNNPFIAYAVINDGANPGEQSGDGAFIKADVSTAR